MRIRITTGPGASPPADRHQNSVAPATATASIAVGGDW
jgi:hypothetical protein